MKAQQDFCQLILEDCTDTEQINFSANVGKGIITLVWDVTFKGMSNVQAFNQYEDQIKWANSKLKFLENKYQSFHLKTRELTVLDAEHFDKILQTTVQAPVGKDCQTDCQTMGGFVQFKL